MAHQATPSSQKALMMELKSLQEQPVEGFRITLVEESDLYNWEVAIFGPPNTLYEGGYFKVGETLQLCLCRKGQSRDLAATNQMVYLKWLLFLTQNNVIIIIIILVEYYLQLLVLREFCQALLYFINFNTVSPVPLFGALTHLTLWQLCF